jgi:Kef-type K+ transport system membrane component KefB
MTTAEFGSFAGRLLVLFAAAHILGFLFTRLRQPRVVGEILAGVLLGPNVLGDFLSKSSSHEVAISFLYNLGLLLLMFASGAETRGLFGAEDRRQVAWLGLVGTGLPFLFALGFATQLNLVRLMGPANQRLPLVLVIGIAMAVTSIPVISKILHDLKILHTRFARLILGVAVFEDIVLWAVLAVATSLAQAGTMPKQKIVLHVVITLLFFGTGLTVLPKLLRRAGAARWNVVAKNNPLAYLFIVLLGYTCLAALLDVSLVFAAFLAGFALSRDPEPQFTEAISSLSRISFAVFVPVYFAAVGLKLDFSKSFSVGMLAGFLGIACLVKLVSAGLGARLAGFEWRDSVNLSMALNARGGPGIVLASVAFDAGIISASFYTTLVLVAVLTSQAAGAWLDFALRKGWPLLGEACPGVERARESEVRAPVAG